MVQLLEDARAKGVNAEFVDIETFDALTSRIWRQLEVIDLKLDAKVRRAVQRKVEIPLPSQGDGRPILRSNAVHIVKMPIECLQLFFKSEIDWDDLKAATRKSNHEILCTMDSGVFAWGTRDRLHDAFGPDLESIEPANLAGMLHDIDAHTHVKGFVEEALCRALTRGKPLLLRSWRSGWAVIAERNSESASIMGNLAKSVHGKLSGDLVGKFTQVNDDHPKAEKIGWAEAVQLNLEVRNGQFFLLLRPDIWIWPRHGREEVASFLDERKSNRYNSKADEIVKEWAKILLLDDGIGQLSATLLSADTSDENPLFLINSQLAITGRGIV